MHGIACAAPLQIARQVAPTPVGQPASVKSANSGVRPTARTKRQAPRDFSLDDREFYLLDKTGAW